MESISANVTAFNPWGRRPYLPLYPVTQSPLWKVPARRGFILADLAAEFCRDHSVRLDALKGPTRHRPLVWLRQEFMAQAYARGAPYAAIGRFLSRDHTTIMHGVRAHWERAG